MKFKVTPTSHLRLSLNRQVEFEFGGKLIFRIQSVRKINTTNSAVGVNLNPESFYVVSSVSPACKIGQVELNLVPALIEPHGHRADEGLHSSGGLVVAGPESPPHILVIQNLLNKKIFNLFQK